MATGDRGGQPDRTNAVLDPPEVAHHRRREQIRSLGPRVLDRLRRARQFILDILVEDEEPSRWRSFAQTFERDDVSEMDPLVVAPERALPRPLPQGPHVHRSRVYALVDPIEWEPEDRGCLDECAVGKVAGGQFPVECGNSS